VVDPDPALLDSKRPGGTEQEFDGYVWDTSNGRKRGEEPVKKDDHGMDALRYLVAHRSPLQPNRKMVSY
jgi:phage terminase large subunit